MSNSQPSDLDLEQLCAETGVPVDVLRTLAAISNPKKVHVFTAETARLALGAVRSDHGDGEVDVSSSLSRMKHPVFACVARRLEQHVPAEQGFGRFRDSPEAQDDAEMAFLLTRDDVSDEELVARVQSAPDMGGALIAELSDSASKRSKPAK